MKDACTADSRNFTYTILFTSLYFLNLGLKVIRKGYLNNIHIFGVEFMEWSRATWWGSTLQLTVFSSKSSLKLDLYLFHRDFSGKVQDYELWWSLRIKIAKSNIIVLLYFVGQPVMRNIMVNKLIWLTDHIPTAFTDVIPITSQPHTHHILPTYQLPLLTSYQSHPNHIPTTYWPHTNCLYRPHTDQINLFTIYTY